MDKNKIKLDIEKISQQINNLDIIHEKTELNVKIPEKDALDKLYVDFKTFNNLERNMFLSKLSKIEEMNTENRKFNTIKSEQRNFLLEKLKERVIELEKKLDEDCTQT